MIHFFKYLVIIFLLLFISSVYSQNSTKFTVFSVGNIDGENKNVNLSEQLRTEADKHNHKAVLFAGNAVNPITGKIPDDLLPDKNLPLLIAPGNSEWGGGTRNGKDFTKQLNKALSQKTDNPVFMPDPACPGPAEVVLSEHLAVILIDTWWWVHKYDRRFNKCKIKNQSDVIVQIEDAIRRHYDTKHVMIAGYHTLKSFGNSSGYFYSGQWLKNFPYTFYRKVPGTRYDNQHPDFKDFRNSLLSVMKKYPDIIYVSAGEANMQYFTYDKVHFVISGSWQKQEFVNKDFPEFSSEENGFSSLVFSSDGVCELSFFNTENKVFRKTLYKKEFIKDEINDSAKPLLPDSIVAIASEKYNISESGYKWMGENYRSVWAEPVKLPVFDIGTKKEGLKILKRGGGQQTFSLRLEDKNGKQYVLRSVDKFVEGAVPEELHTTFAVDLVQDQISASNPYAAPVVAQLAEYAGIYHANPEVVYVPDDSRYGIYRRDVAGKLFLFEERPAGNRNDVASFGFSENIISTEKVIGEITNSASHSVDEQAVLRARLFDIIINDWDRHDDQWRWAGFENNGKTIYKPIPRDRDQAFFVNEGILPWIAARNWLMPKIQGFTEYTQNIVGHSFNARHFDRSFLTQSSWKEWLLQIDTLHILLSFPKIDSAMYAFPKEVYPLCGPETAGILKARLKNLKPMARQLYLSLAKEVSITGTNQSDYFEIVALSDSTLSISGYELQENQKAGDMFYHRKFYASETKKINLYGLNGDDLFEIKGNENSKIILNIVGGKGKNKTVSGNEPGFNKINIYDKTDTEISPELSAGLKTKFESDELEYDREHFKNDMVYPGLFSGYNPDDGVFIGGGPVFTKYSRYKQQQYDFFGNYALATQSFNLRFMTQQKFPLKRLELNFMTQYKSPEYFGNFFGMGNETVWEVPRSEKRYYRLRMKNFLVSTDLKKWLDKNKSHQIGGGLLYSYTDVEKTAGRYILNPENGLAPNDLSAHSYTGVYMEYEWNTLRGVELKTEEEFAGSNIFMTRGMRLTTNMGYFAGLNSQTDNYFKFSANWISYLSFSQRPRVVYVFRTGGEKLYGNYAFHEAATLGRTDYLRGYRETRFYGDASFFLNLEARIRLKQFQTYLINGTAGVFVFNDTGRVWLNGEKSKKWHNGTGLGVWSSLFDMAVVSLSYAVSPDDKQFNFSMIYRF